ncbi:MAG: ABC transporter permease [candidate division KSB1 bacterium]|nr:ABC transporter permease [candidate division KSB1 bacterium]MDZ7340504.1 ABC transporter permease [candidate division KSB1 bacterium]
MSRGYLYSIVEGFKGLRRAKFSAFVSISTIFLALCLIGVFTILVLNVRHFVNQLKSKLELEVFVDNSLVEEQLAALQQQIAGLAGVDSVRYISKEQAAAIFKQEVGQDIFVILDDNPLPPSFQIKLQPTFQSSAQAMRLAATLRQLPGVDEVIYRHDLLVRLEQYSRLLLIIILGIGVLLAIGAIFLVYNTIKLIILSRRSVIEIMKLVGATQRFIRRPFMIEGMIQGLIGSSLAALLFYALATGLKDEIAGLITVDRMLYPGLILGGIFLGLVGSLLALRKFLKY